MPSNDTQAYMYNYLNDLYKATPKFEGFGFGVYMLISVIIVFYAVSEIFVLGDIKWMLGVLGGLLLVVIVAQWINDKLFWGFIKKWENKFKGKLLFKEDFFSEVENAHEENLHYNGRIYVTDDSYILVFKPNFRGDDSSAQGVNYPENRPVHKHLNWKEPIVIEKNKIKKIREAAATSHVTFSIMNYRGLKRVEFVLKGGEIIDLFTTRIDRLQNAL